MNLCAIGTGAITKSMLAEFQRSEVLHVSSVYSRKEETGRAIAEEFGLEKVYTSLDEMLADPAIDMVYVASLNSIHYSQTKAALLAGKHVICEKPFAPTVADICRQFSLSRSTLQLLFRNTVNQSPKKYISDMKLERSCQMLRENKYTISEISLKLGYSSIHYFSNAFNQKYHISPSEYAKRIY